MHVHIGCISLPWSSQHFKLSGSLDLLLHHSSYLHKTWLAVGFEIWILKLKPQNK